MRIAAVVACVALAAAARADVESGPKAGEKVPALKAFAVVGPVEGKELDLAAARKDLPTVYLFVQGEHWSRPTARFLKGLDAELGKRDDGAAAVAVWLGDKAFDAQKEYLPRAQTSLQFGKTTLAAYDGAKTGPAGWDVNADAHLTVVVAHRGKVVKSFPFVSVNETDVRAVVAELKKAAGK